METFYLEYKNELLGTGICLLVLLILKYLGTKAIQKVGKISDINEVRTRLIVKYSTVGLSAFGIVALILICPFCSMVHIEQCYCWGYTIFFISV